MCRRYFHSGNGFRKSAKKFINSLKLAKSLLSFLNKLCNDDYRTGPKPNIALEVFFKGVFARSIRLDAFVFCYFFFCFLGGFFFDFFFLFTFQMMQHAWAGYAKYAWGKNEVRPVSLRGHTASIFGQASMGATIVDSLDTLYIMGMMDEYEKAREWVESELDFNKMVSVYCTSLW